MRKEKEKSQENKKRDCSLAFLVSWLETKDAGMKIDEKRTKAMDQREDMDDKRKHSRVDPILAYPKR